MRVHLRHGQQHLPIDVQRDGSAYRLRIDGVEHQAEVHYLDASSVLLMLDGRPCRVAIARRGRERWVAVAGENYSFVAETAAAAHRVDTVAPPEITAPMPGKVLDVLVRAGEPVEAGSALLTLEAMKMETRLLAEAAGIVAEVRVVAGDMVDGGQVLVVLAYDEP
jgi:biotin carboxyl carrier protein